MNQKIKDFGKVCNHDCNIVLLCNNELIISCFHKLHVGDYFIFNTVYKAQKQLQCCFRKF